MDGNRKERRWGVGPQDVLTLSVRSECKFSWVALLNISPDSYFSSLFIFFKGSVALQISGASDKNQGWQL